MRGYFATILGLRDYGLNHQYGAATLIASMVGEPITAWRICSWRKRNRNTLSGISGTEIKQGQFCQKCGAWCGCYGMEPTPEMYVEHTVQIFREIRRVLRDDGTLWLNLGDSYAGSNQGAGTK